MKTTDFELIDINKKSEIHNIFLFSLGKIVSLFGTSIYTFAIGLYVLKLTGSGLSFATTLIFGMLPVIIINPIAGVLADRVDRKALTIIMDLLNGSLLMGLFIITLNGKLELTVIYISTFTINAFTALYDIGIEASIPNIVSQKKLMQLNSISKVAESASSILAPILGGLIFAFIDLKFFIIFNSLSFLFSGIMEFFIDFKLNIITEDIKQTGKFKIDWFMDLKDAFNYMLSKAQIVNSFAVFVFLNFFISLSISIPLPYILNNILKLDAMTFGMIQAGFPVGAILGAILVRRISGKYEYNKLLIKNCIVLSVCIVMIGLPLLIYGTALNKIFLLIYYSFIMVILGLVISFIDIPLIYMLQMTIAENYRGRVLSLGMSLVKIIVPVALIVSGLLINTLPPFTLPFIGGLFLLLISLIYIRKWEPKKVKSI